MKLLLIVGPSGAGKDTLLRSARTHFQQSERLGFVRRYITRPPDSNEDNYFIDPQGFMMLRDADFFLSNWQAHNNYYGVARHALTGVNGHRALLCSISRSAIQDFEHTFTNTITINITVPEELLLQRLRTRGRENSDQIAARLERAHRPVGARELVTFDNSQSLAESVSSFIALLQKFC